MPKTLNSKQIKGVQKLLTLLEPDALTRKEFVDNFRKILKFIEMLKSKNKEDFEGFRKTAQDLNNKLKGDNEVGVSELKQGFIKLINKALKEQEAGMNFIRDKVRSIKSGIDGKSGKDGKDGISGIDGKDGNIITPVEIADKLEELEGDDRLDVKAIKNLEYRLEELEGRPMGGTGAGVGKLALQAHFIDDETPSGAINGTNKAFVLANTPVPPASVKVFADGQRLNLTEDYTFLTRTITFVDAPLANTIIKVDYKI